MRCCGLPRRWPPVFPATFGVTTENIQLQFHTTAQYTARLPTFGNIPSIEDPEFLSNDRQTVSNPVLGFPRAPEGSSRSSAGLGGL